MIRNRETRQRALDGDYPRLLPARPPAEARQPPTDPAYEAWLVQMVLEDRADCAPYFPVSADG